MSVVPEPGGPGGPLAPQYLADQLTIFEPGGGQIIPTYYYWPPNVFHLPAPLNV